MTVSEQMIARGRPVARALSRTLKSSSEQPAKSGMIVRWMFDPQTAIDTVPVVICVLPEGSLTLGEAYG
jgi:hypothetical protein